MVWDRDAKVKSLEKFGLFVEILPGKEGLVHTSELDVDRSVSVDAFSVGDSMDVKLLEVRLQGPSTRLGISCTASRRLLPSFL